MTASMRSGPAGPAWIERVVASRNVRASYVSLVAHVVVLLLLAMLVGRPRSDSRPLVITLRMADDQGGEAAPAAGADGADGDAPGEPGGGDPTPPVQPETVFEIATALAQPPAPAPPEPAAAVSTSTAASAAAPAVAEPVTPPTPARMASLQGGQANATGGPSADATGVQAAATRGHGQAADPFGGRSGAGRQRGVATNGGSAASEAAVARGLEWLARHQAADGSWRFDLSGCRCDGACRNPGNIRSTTAATGIALLPFLGAGQTHERGEHAQTVTRGLYYLMSKMQATPRGGDLSEGTMYGHGVATLALAEALGMTGDRMLVPSVRDAVRFLETSQDMHGGGWRYLPGQPGDTTVTAWQLAALKSAALAGVEVPSPTIHGICEFLDRLQVRGGEGYGYLGPQENRPCTSAIGLLCRIYTAWPEQATLDRGLGTLAARGPDREAVYQNFYLAQALLLRNHAAWPRWNARNRDQLVARQDRGGHEVGSWVFADADTAPGGRLGHTALAILTLEVYYRLLPIYTEEAADLRW